ncbi:PHP domain-containing protein [Candidatus Woesearchaeota archaeon]|nr:PHP domain-containing protein [Candidatus Woesearchaeota archaeon]
MLKVDFHLHSALDPKDDLKHSPEQLIDLAASNGYDVLCFTHHEGVVCPRSVVSYARKKGILVIPGAEAAVEGMHVLLINIAKSQLDGLQGLDDLSAVKGKHTLIIAPHPFYPSGICLRSKLVKYAALFDGVEYSHFYTSWYNAPNRKSAAFARRLGLPVVGSSDCHDLSRFGTTYSMVDAKSKTAEGVITAVKRGRVKAVSKPLRTGQFLGHLAFIAWQKLTGTGLK